MLNQFCTGLTALSPFKYLSATLMDGGQNVSTSLKVITDKHYKNNTDTVYLSYLLYLLMCICFLP